MSVKSNISISLYTRVSLLQSDRVYTLLPYPNCSCSLLFSRIIHGFSVVPRGKLRSWKVGKLLPLLVCPRCVIDTGHGMDGSVEGEAAKNGRTEERLDGWVWHATPAGQHLPPGAKLCSLIFGYWFSLRAAFGARDHSQRTHQVSPSPSHSRLPLALRRCPLLPASFDFSCLIFLPQFCSAFLCSRSSFSSCFLGHCCALKRNVVWSAEEGESEEDRERDIERGRLRDVTLSWAHFESVCPGKRLPNSQNQSMNVAPTTSLSLSLSLSVWLTPHFHFFISRSQIWISNVRRPTGCLQSRWSNHVVAARANEAANPMKDTTDCAPLLHLPSSLWPCLLPARWSQWGAAPWQLSIKSKRSKGKDTQQKIQIHSQRKSNERKRFEKHSERGRRAPRGRGEEGNRLPGADRD